MGKLVAAFLAGALVSAAVGSLAALALAAVASIFLGIVASDIDRNAAAVGVKIVEAAAILVHRRERDECRAEWSDDVRSASEDQQGVRPLVRALAIAMIGAPLVGAMSRYDVARRRRRRI